MPSLLARLRNVVWTAVFALVGGCAALVAGVAGASIEAVAGIGIYAVVMAILTPKVP